MFEKLNLDPQYLNVDSLDVHCVSKISTYISFIFHKKYPQDWYAFDNVLKAWSKLEYFLGLVNVENFLGAWSMLRRFVGSTHIFGPMKY